MQNVLLPKAENDDLLELDGINDEEVEADVVAMKSDGEKERKVNATVLRTQTYVNLIHY
jgi:hypothetical protein